MKKTLSITVYNESGVLTRISTVFSSRGFNIDSITVGSTEDPGISRIIIVLPAEDETIVQIVKQLHKLVQVIHVKDITYTPCVERELMLIKIANTTRAIRLDLVQIAQIFRAKIVDISDDTLTMEITGDPGKIVTLQELLKNYNVLEIVRTGKIAIERELGINTESLKFFERAKS